MECCAPRVWGGPVGRRRLGTDKLGHQAGRCGVLLAKTDVFSRLLHPCTHISGVRVSAFVRQKKQATGQPQGIDTTYHSAEVMLTFVSKYPAGGMQQASLNGLDGRECHFQLPGQFQVQQLKRPDYAQDGRVARFINRPISPPRASEPLSPQAPWIRRPGRIGEALRRLTHLCM